MELIGGILLLIVLVVAAMSVLGLKEVWKHREIQKRYRQLQSTRSPLSADEFCTKARLDKTAVLLVSAIRGKLADSGKCDASRIYPEDPFCPQFGLNYDDDVAMIVQKMQWVEGFTDYSFPLEEVNSVADFVRVILRLKSEEKHQTDAKNSAHSQ